MSVRGLRRGRPKRPRTGGGTRSSSSTSWVTTTELRSVLKTLKSELGYDEEKEEYLDIIMREIKRVATLVTDFFSYVRPVDPKVDLPRLEERVLEFWRGAGIFAKSLALREGSPEWVTGATEVNSQGKAIAGCFQSCCQTGFPSG